MTPPDPLTPPECDLRGFDFMPLFGHHLFGSNFYAESTGDEFRAAVRLWWAAWLQQPAASLPVSDNALAVLADYGRDLKGWLKVKDKALHGFVLCSDGRLYHEFLSDEAIKSYALRLKSDAKRAKDRERLQAWRDARKTKQSSDMPDDNGSDGGNGNETRFETPRETVSETTLETSLETQSETRFVAGRQDRTEQDKERKTPSLRSPPQKRRSQIDPNWQPDAAGRDKAAECGVCDLQREVTRFRDHHASKGSLMADWAAAWRTWCGNSQRFAKPQARFSAGPRGALEVFGLVEPDENLDEPRLIQ